MHLKAEVVPQFVSKSAIHHNPLNWLKFNLNPLIWLNPIGCNLLYSQYVPMNFDATSIIYFLYIILFPHIPTKPCFLLCSHKNFPLYSRYLPIHLEVSQNRATPSHHPFRTKGFSIVNHPAIRVPP